MIVYPYFLLLNDRFIKNIECKIILCLQGIYYRVHTLTHMKISNTKTIPKDIAKISLPHTWYIPRWGILVW